MKVVGRVAVTVAVATAGLCAATGVAGAKGGEVGGFGAQYLLNDSFGATANRVFIYGNPGDLVYFGDWDGNGSDTPMVRRGNIFYVRNDTVGGVADTVFSYGDPGDEVLVGDWDGNGTDSEVLSVAGGLATRR